MGKKFIADKIMSGLVGVFSAVVMIFAIMFAIVRENMWPFLIVAALVCPLWHWLLRKFILKEKMLLLWLIRGGAVLGGCLLFAFSARYFPYYTCMDVMIEDCMKTQYEETVKTDTTELVDVTGIQKELFGDYYKVKATVNYRDKKSGENLSEEIALYFDRYKGQYFANFENMRKYRAHYWDYEEGWDICMVDQEELKNLLADFYNTLISGDREAAKTKMCSAMKNTLTEEEWTEWTKVVSDAGTYASADAVKTTSMEYETEDGTPEGKRNSQVVTTSCTLHMSSGDVVVQVAVAEDLLIRNVSVSKI